MDSYAQTAASGLTSGFASRQQTCLNRIVETPGLDSFDRAIALAFLDRNADEVNRLLQQVTANDLSLTRSFCLLRLLFQSDTGTGGVNDESQRHLEQQLNAFVQNNWEHFSLLELGLQESQVHTVIGYGFLYLWGLYGMQKSLDFQVDSVPIDRGQLDRWKSKILSRFEEWSKFGFCGLGYADQQRVMQSLLDLYEFSDDPAFQSMSAAMIDLILLDFALETVGPLQGGVRQSVLDTPPLGWDTYMPVVFFGLEVSNSEDGPFDASLFSLCNTEYRPPPVLEQLGAQQDLRGIFELKHTFLWKESFFPQEVRGRKYSYVTPDYVLSSYQQRNAPVPSHSRPWDLSLRNGNETPTHLFNFVGDQLYSGGEPESDDAYFVWKASTFQYKNIMFCRFHKSTRVLIDLDSGEELLQREYQQLPLRVWIPDTLDDIERKGDWWFARHDKVYLAYRPVKGNSYWWRTADMGGGRSSTASILSCQDLYAGFLLEVEQAKRFSSFLQFEQQIVQAPLIVDRNSITFVSRRGDVFLFPLDLNDFLVNGRVIDPASDPEYDLYASPYSRSQYGSGYYSVRWSPFSLVLDLRDIRHPVRTINAEPNDTVSAPPQAELNANQ